MQTIIHSQYQGHFRIAGAEYRRLRLSPANNHSESFAACASGPEERIGEAPWWEKSRAGLTPDENAYQASQLKQLNNDPAGNARFHACLLPASGSHRYVPLTYSENSLQHFSHALLGAEANSLRRRGLVGLR